MPAFGDAAALVLPAAPGDTAGAGADPEPLTAQTDTKREQTPGKALSSWPSGASEPRNDKPALWAPSMARFLPFLLLPIVMAPARCRSVSFPKVERSLDQLGDASQILTRRFWSRPPTRNYPRRTPPLGRKFFAIRLALALPRLLPTIEGNPNLGTARSPQTPPLSPLSAEHLKPEVRTSSAVLWMHRRWGWSWLLGCWCGSSKVVRVLLTAYFTVRNLIDRTCPMGDPVGMAEPATVPSELCLFTSLMPGDGTMPRAQWLGNPVEIACFQPIHHSSCSSRC
ncbi:hypothetical protein BGZ61DRAFT_221862 [Ilyonectria robusta]|uniref:uncharacterized protein n=1 Tax=Ilyonectria robusta TaxID=1079257 RepID=UPI001E8CBAD5|nr:uncharacterized protein BGZ61DRAFT_221862 [Ilyonectria robusta]KAH8706500.1 hypothetical protein BGZ61DRAFT_221862 [Ilyonectria robusta]